METETPKEVAAALEKLDVSEKGESVSFVTG
jgi:hypothetical protein